MRAPRRELNVDGRDYAGRVDGDRMEVATGSATSRQTMTAVRVSK